MKAGLKGISVLSSSAQCLREAGFAVPGAATVRRGALVAEERTVPAFRHT